MFAGLALAPRMNASNTGQPPRDLHDLRRILQPVLVPIVAVLRLDEHVAEDRVLDPGLHLLDQVLAVDVADHFVCLATAATGRANSTSPPAAAGPPLLCA